MDHLVIDGRHSSGVIDIRVIRGANIDSDHYLVAAKVRTRIRRAKAGHWKAAITSNAQR